jgi:hypothetical protein
MSKQPPSRIIRWFIMIVAPSIAGLGANTENAHMIPGDHHHVGIAFPMD